MKCAHCEKEFEPKRWFRKYCSVSCKNPKNRKGNIPWNKGLTKEDPRVAAYAERGGGQFRKGNISWNEGLTKHEDLRVAKQGANGLKNGYHKMTRKQQLDFACAGRAAGGGYRGLNYDELSEYQLRIINQPFDMEKINGLFK